MKKLLLAAAAPLLVTSQGFGVAKSVVAIGDTKIEAARDEGNGSLRLAQFGSFGRGPRGINGHCGSATGVKVSTAPTSNLCRAGEPTTVTIRRIGRSGRNEWTWSCDGVLGGKDGGCPKGCVSRFL